MQSAMPLSFKQRSNFAMGHMKTTKSGKVGGYSGVMAQNAASNSRI